MQIIYSVQQFFADRRPDKIPIISLNKAMKTFSSLFDEIFSMFRQNYRKMTITAQNIMKRLSENHWLESKKKKQCFPEIIELFICKSEK
ncbi:hypothetical protein EZS27_027203 [termite gut metagenome]